MRGARRAVLPVVLGLGTVAGALVARAGVSRQSGERLYPAARAVVARHCIGCHSAHNTVPAFPIAADGLELDTAEQMQRSAERIRVRAVVLQDMPLLDKTGITAEERASLARWIEAGAPVPR